jgi:hypothetical protein
LNRPRQQPPASLSSKNSERQELTIEDDWSNKIYAQFQFFSNYFANFEKFRFNAYLIFVFAKQNLIWAVIQNFLALRGQS